MEKQISFFVNEKNYVVDVDDPTTTFNSWIRAQPGLSGTKVMCRQGGCGCCVVALQRPSQGVIAVNSCLLPLCSVDGCLITTVEGIGSRRTGFNKIQTRVGEFGASQCGYCTPGFVMSMHSLLQENSSPTQQNIEDNFDGNICRCTGYRTILDAMKCFACDADPKLKEKCQDIEDLVPRKYSPERKDNVKLRSFRVFNGDCDWVRPTSFAELTALLMSLENNNYKLVCGNTGSGVFESDKVFPLYVDVSSIQEFLAIAKHDDSVEFGAGVSLSRIISFLTDNSADSLSYEVIASHLKKVASRPVRNVGSWAGNVMLKHSHNQFPSDVCMLLEASSSKIKVYDLIKGSSSLHQVFGVGGILSLDMSTKILVSVFIPKMKDDGGTKMKTFKIMPRSQNALAYINAGFTSSINSAKGEFVKSTIVFGGISANFSHAHKTEDFLAGKAINSIETLKGALQALAVEVKQECGDVYRRDLAMGLFYKFYLSVCDVSKLGPGIASGISEMVRPVSSGNQTFTPDPSTYPVSQHIPKLSGQLQASGEAYYISDHPSNRSELHCDVVLAKVCNAYIDVIDTSAARTMKGFVDVITKDNFPPDVKNACLGDEDPTQPIVAPDYVSYAGQVVAIVIAETPNHASRIAAAVVVTYKDMKKPIINTRDAIEQQSIYDLHIPDFVLGNPDEAISSSKHEVTGAIDLSWQYHFYTETMVCRAECTEENGFNLESSTQYQLAVQSSISYAFNVPCNKVEVSTKRIGGAYGGKGTNSLMSSCVAALAAYVTNRPVRFHPNLKTSMTMFGTRTPYSADYRVGFDDEGVMQGVDCTFYGNSGCSSNDGEVNDPALVPSFADSAYFCGNRRYKNVMLKTNTASSTWCRAPGSMQLTAFADLIMEHIASFLNKDPIDVKYANLYKHGQPNLEGELLLYCNIRGVYDELLSKYKIKERQAAIETFNGANRWKKRGIAVTPMKCRLPINYLPYGVLVSIYGQDGTVVVSHGGIECGQGINTKVAQTTAYKLGVPLSIVMVQRTNTITSANSQATGGSLTSEAVCKSLIGCCDILNSRIQPIREKAPPDISWEDLITRCVNESIDLNVTHTSAPSSGAYSSFGVTAAEVEFDVITGERQIVQVDTVFDCGISLNPSIDIGQVEGAFIMGVGFWLSEHMFYDEDNGQLSSNDTWTYHPPVSKDIPITWNIDLLKDAPNPLGVLRSKACGEPPLCMALVVALALKRAVESSRRDRGKNQYFPLPTPATVGALHNTLELDPLVDFTLQ